MLRILDLFSGAGGAAMGYHQACEDLGIGHTITGVDIRPMPRYPFEFIQGDALEYLAARGAEYDFIHASPPCQHYTWAAARWGRENYPDLVEPTRQLLQKAGRPYVIENVVGAPVNTVVVLCGAMFGLRLFRHRLFETSSLIFQPHHPAHVGRIGFDDGDYVTMAGHGGDGPAGLRVWQAASGIDWMDKPEMAQAIPPAYTRYIGRQMLGGLS